MFMRTLTKLLLAAAFVIMGPAWSYDAAMAESHARLFASVKGVEAGKALHMMSHKAFIEAQISGKPMLVVDVRTPAETTVVGLALANSIKI